MRARFLWVFIIALAVAALSATTALAMPNLGDLSWDIFGSALSFAGCLFGAMLCAIVIERGRFSVLMICSIAGYAIACMLAWALIWYPFGSNGMWEEQEFVGKLLLTFTIGPVVLTSIGLLRLLNPAWGFVRLVRIVTETIAGAFGVFSLLMFWEVFDTLLFGPSEIEMRIWSGLLILSIAGLLGTPALRAVEISRRKDSAESGLPMRISIAITCPRCEHQQSIPTGGAICAKCGLSINVNIEETQCPGCGYSLAKLDSATCPECGSKTQ